MGGSSTSVSRPRISQRVGALEGNLQEHGASWTPPAPTPEDGARSLQLVEALVSTDHAAVFARALEVVWATTRKLAEETNGFGLIHGDLHYENFLFHRSEARAIDFDDCGWGFHLYDLAVTLSELENRPRYDELRDALLEAYAQLRPLPEDHAIHLRALFVLRRMQILLWVLESREHAAFRDEWQAWARKELDAIATGVGAEQIAPRAIGHQKSPRAGTSLS